MVSIDDTDFGTGVWHTRQCEETIRFAREGGDVGVLKYVVDDVSIGVCKDQGPRLLAEVAAFGKPGQDIIANRISEIVADRERAREGGNYPLADGLNARLAVFDY